MGTSASSLRPDRPSTSSRVRFPEIVTSTSWLSPSHSGAGALAMMASSVVTKMYCTQKNGGFSTRGEERARADLRRQSSRLAIRRCLGDSQPERWREGLCPGGPGPKGLPCRRLDGGSTGHSGSAILKRPQQEFSWQRVVNFKYKHKRRCCTTYAAIQTLAALITYRK